jgi:hypothetical protein
MCEEESSNKACNRLEEFKLGVRVYRVLELSTGSYNKKIRSKNICLDS